MACSFLVAVALRRADVLCANLDVSSVSSELPGDAQLCERTVLAWITAGKDVDKAANLAGGATPLWHASRDGDRSAVALLLHAGAALDRAKSGGITPLYIAAFSGHEAVVALLLHALADTSLAKANGVGPLHIASSKGHLEVVKILLRATAAPEQCADDGTSPLHAACRRGHSRTVGALIGARAAVDRVANDGSSPLLVAVHRVVTPLYEACQRGHTALVAMLCAAGATVDGPAERGNLAERTAEQLGGSCMAPLNIACQEGHTDTVSVLLAARADVNRRRGGHTPTPLLIATDSGHDRIASALLAAGAAVDDADEDGETALLKAASHGLETTVAALLSLGASVNESNGAGASPMYMACREGHLRCVQLLSSYGATRVATISGMQQEMVHVARRAGAMHVAAWLEGSVRWATPLHHLSVIDAARARELLRGGASIYVGDGLGLSGDTPHQIAMRVHAAGGAGEGTAAALVLRAAERWSPATHELFPRAVRMRAVEVMLLCCRLARSVAHGAHSGALFDALVDRMIPELLARKPPGLGPPRGALRQASSNPMLRRLLEDRFVID
jgi:ankyrin repeat protein